MPHKGCVAFWFLNFYFEEDELEELVNKIEPTAEFNKTMLAEEFRQSQSSNENYTNDYTIDEEDE